MEEIMKNLDKIDFISDKDIENANFAELALYLQELNKIEEATKVIYDKEDNKNE